MDKKRVGIIIPCYNEAEDIENKSEIVIQYLNNLSSYSFELILVNDGSKDNTKEVISHIKGVHLVSYEPNHGKGYAVKEGIKYALEQLKCDYSIFMDADLSTDLKAVNTCLSLLEQDFAFVAGSRYDKDSNIVIKQPFKRRLISKISRMIIKMKFHFKVKETQCGFKGMNKEMMSLVAKKQKMDGFSFDVEYFYLARLYNLRYTTFGVTWKDDRGSTVAPLKSSIQAYKDLFAIKRNKKEYLRNE